MRLKRFVAPDTNKALRLIKETLGDDAVILSSHTVDDGVEVVAAVDYDESVIEQGIAHDVAEPVIDRRLSELAYTEPKNSLDEVREEVHLLRELLEHQLSSFAWQNKSQQKPLHMVLIHRLTQLGFDQFIAEQFVDGIDIRLPQHKAWQHVLKNILNAVPSHDLDICTEGGIFALIGATGVGKTTSIAKLAARFSLRHGAENLGLITMDGYRIAAHEQLNTYGKILGVSVSIADDPTSLERALSKLQNKKLVLIDTAGMNPNDVRMAELMGVLKQSLYPINTSLVLSATSQLSVLRNCLSCYASYNVNNCIVTKVDECLSIGPILSVLCDKQLPITYLTDGQRVPEDIKQASPQVLLDKIINSVELSATPTPTPQIPTPSREKTSYAQ